jgi:hypothetical protein
MPLNSGLKNIINRKIMSEDLEIKLSHLFDSDKEETLKQVNELVSIFISSASTLRALIEHTNDSTLNKLTDIDDNKLICKVILGLAYSSMDEFHFLAFRERYNENINFSCEAYNLKRDEILSLISYSKPLIEILNNSGLDKE